MVLPGAAIGALLGILTFIISRLLFHVCVYLSLSPEARLVHGSVCSGAEVTVLRGRVGLGLGLRTLALLRSGRKFGGGLLRYYSALNNTVTYTILEVPYSSYSIMGPKTLF